MSDPYIQFYPSDWLAGTRGLTASETGIYITVIAMIYEREAPLDMPNERLARLCGCTVTNLKRAIDVLISEGKIILKDGGLWNTRAECELQKRSAKRDSAKQAIYKRWGKSEQNQCKDDTDVLRTSYENDTNQNQNQSIDTDVSIIFRETDPDISQPAISQPKAPTVVGEAVQIFRSAAARRGWPQPQVETPQRIKAIAARLADCGGLDGWQTAIDKAEASDFLTGRTQKSWGKFNLDWLLKPANFAKLMEGNYDNRSENANGAGKIGGSGRYADQQTTGMASAFAAVAARAMARHASG